MEVSSLIEINNDELDDYVIAARDRVLYTGLPYFMAKKKEDDDFSKISFLSFAMLPSPTPRKEFYFACDLQKEWNILLHKCSRDHDFLHESLKGVLEHDSFTKRIWDIYEKVHNEGSVQPISLNIVRSDYMIAKKSRRHGVKETVLSQIEINTYACGGVAIYSKLVELYKYMLLKTNNKHLVEKVVENEIYDNTIQSLIKTWELYNNKKAHILLLVRDTKINYSDHRLIEYELMRRRPDIKFFRATFEDVNRDGKLDDEKKFYMNGYEIALVYYKSGFDPSDYPTENSWSARLLIERSMAIKAPKIEYQLMCTKKFQQHLTELNVLEKFIDKPEVLDAFRATFFPQYSFNEHKCNKLMLEKMKSNYENYVLKPQREGGGYNIYGVDIKKFVEGLKDESELYSYILMERIEPVEHENYIISIYENNVQKRTCISEVGIFGISISDSSDELIFNETSGYVVKEKYLETNEAAIMKGHAGFGSCYFED